MKPAVTTISEAAALGSNADIPVGASTGVTAVSQAAGFDKGWAGVYLELFKARLTLLVLLTAAVGFYAGHRGPMDYALMFHAVFGTALVAAGASALNQLFERRYDARMRRTQDRPLPAGRLLPATVRAIGVACSVTGLVYLALAVNLIICALGAACLLIYLFLYTPLKRLTWTNTLVGAVSGALPPLMGWTAARGQISAGGLALFAILACWQLPHFMAIAWIYRDDYANAGFKMLPVLDQDGHRTSRQAILWASALLAASLLPFLFKLAGPVYLAGALFLGFAFLWSALRFGGQRSLPRARQLFYLSLLYLPVSLVLMVLDKIK